MRVLIRPSKAELGVWGLTASLLGSFCTRLGAPKEGGAPGRGKDDSPWQPTQTPHVTVGTWCIGEII